MTLERALTVVLVDDHAMLREGLRRSLTGLGHEVVAEASDGSEAVEVVGKMRPDAVLMDVTMPVMDGIEAAKRITAVWPQAKIIMLTMHSDPLLTQRARDAGASGYLVKDCTTDDISAALTAATNGEKVFPPGSPSSAAELVVPITQREIEVLQLIASGCSTTDVASALYVSVKTVKNHLGSIYAKLDTHDRTQAVLKAARMGLIDLER